MRRVLGRGRTAVSAGMIFLCVTLWGCATTESWRPAMGTPDHFLVGAIEGVGTSEPVADGRCHSPMVDPADGTKLVMDRAEKGYGDYLVPAGRYGVGGDEVLRIECATGRPVGIFKRQGD